jgi:DnaJ family protein C protein 2
MERQNKKTRDKLKKEEKARISKLTETAYNLDPRVKKNKEQQEAERQRKKQAKEEAVRRKKEQQERQEAAERERKLVEEQARAEEAKRMSREKEQLKRDLQNKRKKLREYCRNLKGVTPVDVESLCLHLDLARTTSLLDLLDAAANDLEQSRVAVRAELNRIKEAQQTEERKVKSEADKKESREAKPWTAEELSQLARALTRYPAGSQNRWQSVAEMISTRNLNEVISKAQSAKNSRPQELQKKKILKRKMHTRHLSNKHRRKNER